MKPNLLHQTDDGQRTFVLVFSEGDEVIARLTEFAREHRVTAASFNAIGALSRATVRFFDWQKKDYLPIPIDEQVEVLVFTGNIALKPDGGPKIHAHAVLGKLDGTAHGGDVGEAHVRPTLELVLIESPAYLRRRHDERTGLSLINSETRPGAT